MKKRILAVTMVLGMMLQQMVFADSSDSISLGEPVFDGQKITVTATTSLAGERYTMVVTNKGGDSSAFEDTYAVREAVSGENLRVKFIFKMPDTRESLVSEENPDGLTDGMYTISVRGKNTDKVTLDFSYVSSKGKELALGKLAGASVSEAESLLDANSTERTAYVNAGFDFVSYDAADEELKEDALEIFVDNMPEDKDDMGNVFNTAVLMALINAKPENAEKYLETSRFEYDGVAFTDSENKEWIADVYEKNAPYTEINKFNVLYEISNILYEINNAKYDTVDNLIFDNASNLGIEGNSVYSEYKALKSDDLTATGEVLVKKLSKAPVYSVNELIETIDNSITKASKETSKNTGSSGKSSNGVVIVDSAKIDEIKATQSNSKSEASVEGFTDLDDVDWAKDAIKYLYDRKIVSGIGDDKFNPNGNVTREAFAKMVVVAIDAYNSEAKCDFSDVVSGSWYETYVASGSENGIISGMGDGTFGVGNNITRQDVAVIIARAAEKKGLALMEASGDAFADDELISDYAKESVYRLTASGLINGVGDNMFDPQGMCTRAQAARLTYMLITYNPEDEIEDNNNSANNDSIVLEPTLGGTKHADKLRFLQGLGMYAAITPEYFNDDETILKSVFIKNAMRLVCGEEIADEALIEMAKGYGIGASDDYDYTGAMSCDEAVSIVVRLSSMESLGSESDKLVAAYKSSVLRGVNAIGTEAITHEDVITLLYNAAMYEGVVEADINNNYSITKDTILENRRNIYELKGIVTDNDMTSLTGESTVSKGEVKIGGTVALEGISGASEYLGKYVSAYIYYGDDENKVIYVEASDKRNTELVISADDIEDVDMSSRQIAYIIGDKTKNVKYSPAVKVVKNGKYLSDYKQSDIDITNGSIRLVDNDNDGIFDIIFIENYMYIIADGVLVNKNIIMNVYQNPVSFDFYNVENYSIIYNGKEITLSDIKQKDVLNILSTGNNDDDKVIIYVTKDKVSGKVTGINVSEETVQIDNISYKLSDVYLKAEKDQDSKYVEMKVGKEYDIYLDKFGKIAYVEIPDSMGDYSYVYGTKLYETEEDPEVYELKYFSMNTSKWEKAQFADKVRYNQEGIIKQAQFINKIQPGFKADIYRIKLNEEGQISSFEIAEETNNTSVFNKYTMQKPKVWSVNAYALENEMFLDGSSKVLLIPKNGDEGEYVVSNRAYFKVDNAYQLIGYGMDEYNCADVTVYIDDTTTVSDSSTPMIVEYVSNSLVDDEVLPVAHGAVAGQSDYSIVGAKEGVFDGVEAGDLIAIKTNGLGRVSNKKVLFSPVREYGKKVIPDTYQNGNVFVAGHIESIDQERQMLRLDNGVEGGQVLQTNSRATVFIYDMADDTIKAGSVKDIIKGDYVYMKYEWSLMRLVYVVRK